MAWAPKDPSDALDYVFDWTDELAVEGDTISTSTWAITSDTEASPTLTKDSDEIIAPANVITRVWLSSGTADTTYKVENTITVASGPPTRIYQRYANLKVKNVKVS